MRKDMIKNEIQDLRIILNKKIPSTKLSIHERITLYTEIMETLEYKQLKKAVIDGEHDDIKSIIGELPKDKQSFFERLLQYEKRFQVKVP